MSSQNEVSAGGHAFPGAVPDARQEEPGALQSGPEGVEQQTQPGSQSSLAGPAGSQPPAGGQFGTSGQAGGSWQPGDRAPWKVSREGRTVFRRPTPLILWWIWVAFVIFNVIQVIVPDHDYFALEFAAGLLAATGVAYATALRPRVLADREGILVHNPVADHVVKWGAVEGVYLGDSVELSCTRPQERPAKTVYCWALYSGRRSRLKSQQLGVRSWGRMSSRAPAEARELAEQDASQVIAAELGRRSTEARQSGVPDATLETRWAWLPIASMVVPAALLVVLLLVR